MTLDGYPQTGATFNTLADGSNAKLLIELNGQNAGASAVGIDIAADNCVVQGLVINRFGGVGVQIAGSSNPVGGNFIGTNAAGNAALGVFLHDGAAAPPRPAALSRARSSRPMPAARSPSSTPASTAASPSTTR